MNFRHEQTFQDDTVELALGTSGQESVQLNEESQVDILRSRLTSDHFPVVLVANVDTLTFK